MKIETVHKIWESDFSDLVSKVYGRPYQLQQQGDCYGQDSIIEITVPEESDWLDEDDITFQQWLDADPEAPVRDERFELYEALRKKNPEGGYDKFYTEEFTTDPSTLELHWHREFYPPLQDVVNDLHEKGHLPAGNYVIHVWW